MSDILPAKNTVVIIDIPQKTKSGLAVPTSGKDAPEIGKVVEIGKGVKPLDFKIGDVIVYRKYMDNKINIAQIGKDYNFVDFKDVLAKIL